jgi:adenine-specific DNA-methyltransferase
MRKADTRGDSPQATGDLLGAAYERRIPRNERKQSGQYYSPDLVIDYILRAVGTRPGMKILDPACGSGRFLVKACALMKIPGGGEYARRKVLEENIFGIDINPLAVRMARENLLAGTGERTGMRLNIAQGDALDRIELGQQPQDENLTYRRLLRHWPFDAVVGNPPYVTFGLRGAGKIGPARATWLRMHYPNSAEYKVSTYALFIERGLYLLKEGGRLGFVLPDSFLLGRYFSKVRQHILDTCKILEIVLFTRDFWQHGAVGRPVILILEKDTSLHSSRITNELRARSIQQLEDLSGSGAKVYSYRQEVFESLPYNRFRLYFDAGSRHFVEKLEEGSEPLSHFAVIRSGIRSRVGQKNIVAPAKVSGTWRKGVVSGREIARYSLKYAGNFINVDPVLLWGGGFDAGNIGRPKLLLRQTGDSLIAALDQDGYYHLNNIHSLSPRDRSPDTLKYLLALLNSELLNRYYHIVSLELGRAMAQTDIETLELLPVKQMDPQVRRDLIRLVDRMLALKREAAEAPTGAEAPNGAERERVETQIEGYVSRIYGFDQPEGKT